MDDQRGVYRVRGDTQAELFDVPEDDLSEDFLQHYCKTHELDSVASLEIKVDAAMQSIESLGALLPNLQELRLSGSSVMCARELGTGFEHLEVLWMSRCGLQELDGITVLHALQELYIAFNDITDLTPLKWLDGLTVLDLEGNLVSEIDDLEDIRKCCRLRELTLSGNPVCRSPEYSRQMLLDLLPNLEVLDEASRYADVESSSTLSACGTNPHFYLDLYLECDRDLYLDLYLDHIDPDDACDRCGASDRAGLGGGATSSSGRSDADRDGDQPCACEGRRRHPLLAQGLRESATMYADEPDELELILEQLKRARNRSLALGGAGATSGTSSAPLGFDLQLPPRGATARVPDTEHAAARSSAAQGVDAASDLTCGGSLAGICATLVAAC